MSIRRALTAAVGCVLVRLGLVAGLSLVSVSGALSADDRHAGYYYPVPQSEEVYNARAQTLEEADRTLRIGFVTGVTNQSLSRPHPPTLAMFAKGTEAQKLIIVALTDGPLDTIYRARAVFANLTAVARVMPIFQELGVQEWFTFFDLAKLMGFQQITITDGRNFAHQVIID
ncbi:MAG: molybdopterin-guanine dinucleotide biosynthesis protein A [Kiloniellales bacterium]|nr:molybdopterin-guanine dinucleotide biosynthesis protein A [Kiloniellales bacterium]